MKIIDAHAHIYPEKIAEKATKSIGEFYDLTMDCTGSVPELLKSGNEVGVLKYIVHSVAIDPLKVEAINTFIANETKMHPEFVGFMTLHPLMTMPQIEQEIDRAIRLNLCGIKMHPDIQQFDIDSADAQKIYDANASRLPILLHTGDERYNYSHPEKLAKMAEKYPATKFVGAHFGGYSKWEYLDCYLRTPNVYFDTSSSLFKLPPSIAVKLMEKLGKHRFFFATDFPITTHKDELERVFKLKLTGRELENLLCQNILDSGIIKL